MGCSFLVIGPKREPLSTGSLCGHPLNYTSTLFISALFSYIKGTCSTQRINKICYPKGKCGKMRVASNEKERKKRGGRGEGEAGEEGEICSTAINLQRITFSI